MFSCTIVSPNYDNGWQGWELSEICNVTLFFSKKWRLQFYLTFAHLFFFAKERSQGGCNSSSLKNLAIICLIHEQVALISFISCMFIRLPYFYLLSEV